MAEDNAGRVGGMSIFTRLFVLLACVAALGAGARAQTADSVEMPAPTPTPKLNIDVATLPSVGRTPNLESQPLKPSDSILSGVDLGGSRLNFEGDRNVPESRVGAERFEPGTLVESRKSRKIGPSFFGLSLKKTLE